MPSFAIQNDYFTLGSQPYQIISGAIHYFRVPRACWDDRLYKARAMGLNTIETYVAWNLHEPRPGEFHIFELHETKNPQVKFQAKPQIG